MSHPRHFTKPLFMKYAFAKQSYSVRWNSSVVHTIDQMLQFSVTNPIYVSTLSMFETIHSCTGLPWWLSIVATTVTVRTAIHMPAMLAAQKNQAKLALLKTELDEEMKSVAAAVRHAKWVHKFTTEQYQESLIKSVKKCRREFYIKHNVHPMKSFLVMFMQMPVWVTLSLTLRTMAGYYGNSAESGFLTEGGPWFVNLALADTTFLLPIALGALTLGNIKLNGKLLPVHTSLESRDIRLQKKSAIISYVMAASLVPFAAVVPSCISLYWVSSALYSLVLYLLFSFPIIRRLSGIPHHPNEPYIRRLLPNAPSSK